jgi:hypothetical protein
MLKVDLWNKRVSRVELDQRARDARLRLELVERLLVPRATATASWFRRVVCLFSFGTPSDGSQASRIRGPLSNNNRRPQVPRGWASPGPDVRAHCAAP